MKNLELVSYFRTYPHRSHLYSLFLALIFLFLNQNSFAGSDHEFLITRATKIYKSKSREEIQLRGVCFGNEVWREDGKIPKTHHSKDDYKKLADLGMNAVRFYMNYKWFESDSTPFKYKEEGFKWLDQNIEWARDNNIYLILNMHVPQGGFQSTGKGKALWDVHHNKVRLVKLWKAIAMKYKNEPVIAGYSILNEPWPSESKFQWKKMADTICKAIRSVNRSQLLFVERYIAFASNHTNSEDLNFFKMEHGNVVYEFHFYAPLDYTHQLAPWTNFDEGGKYPDPNKLEFPQDLEWYTGTFRAPKLGTGSQDWSYYEGVRFKIEEENLVAGKPVFVAANCDGKAYFDHFIVKEFDDKNRFKGTILEHHVEHLKGWGFWSADNSGSYQTVEDYENSTGDHQVSMMIEGTTGDANVYGNKYRFPVKKGYSYSISGWMKGEGIDENCRIQMRLDFEKSPSGSQPIPRDKDYLKAQLQPYLKWAKENRVPLYVGEFGVYKACLEDDKGGAQWVGDMLDLMDEYKLSYTYHAWHEDAFGIYKNPKQLPVKKTANQKIMTVFEQHFDN